MKNCPKCNVKISKKHHYAYKAKHLDQEPLICKTCQKAVDILNGVRVIRPYDEHKTKYFEVHNIVRVSQVGILEKVIKNP